MTFNLKNHKDDLLFLPLGGADEIGMNLNLYYYKGKWLIVDMGIGFADEYYPGVDILVPNIDFLIKHKKDIAGLIVTHAHEDHIGAIQYLWSELECPIYASKFTGLVLKAKLSELGLTKRAKITEVKEETKFDIGPFNIEMIGITHSVPDMHGLMIRTEKGNVFHTGDWKFDHNPVLGTTTDEKQLKKLGDEGILAMVGDSTNVFSEGEAGSEGDLQKSLIDLVAGFKKGMVVITTFASNVARLYSIAKAGEKAGRRVALIGRSLWRMHDAAKECGLLDGLKPFLKDQDVNKYKRDEILIIATGCQGEPRAAMSKFANNAHPAVKLHKDDTVIFASKIIPGNEKKIFYLFNQFCKNGVEVLTENDHFVHVSGHPNRDEVARMYKLLRPQVSVPVHGEPMHIHEHTKFAKEHGAETAIQVEDGKVVKLDPEESMVVGFVETGNMVIDGNFILPDDSEIIRMRRKMRDNGVVVATIILDHKGKLASQPKVLAPGVLDEKEDTEFFEAISDELADAVSSYKKHNDKDLERLIRTVVRRFIKQEIAKEPRILVQIERVR